MYYYLQVVRTTATIAAPTTTDTLTRANTLYTIVILV